MSLIHRIEQFLSAEEVARALEALRMAEEEAAPVYGGGQRVDLRMRSTAKLRPAPAFADSVRELLLGRAQELAELFETDALTLEPLQFLRYREGDFFVAHQDGNTPLIRDDSNFRRVSVVLFLNAPSDTPAPGTYGGGEFLVHSINTRTPVRSEPGTLIAFRSETTHEVAPVTHGERFTIVGWFRLAHAQHG
jgi:SM-20-related protein